MQTDQLKASIQCVGHAIFGKEDRLPSLLDHAAICEIGGVTDNTASGK